MSESKSTAAVQLIDKSGAAVTAPGRYHARIQEVRDLPDGGSVMVARVLAFAPAK